LTWPKLVIETILTAALVGTAAVHLQANRRERAAAADFPPDGQIIKVNDTNMHAVVAGSGPDLVLIHGSSGSTRDFTSGLLPALASRYRVIAIDRPGLGWSDAHPDGDTLMAQAELIKLTAAALGADRPIVLGQSYGGSVGLSWAVEYPETVAALVPVSAPSHPWDTPLSLYYQITSHPLGQAMVIPLLTAFVSPARAAVEIAAVFTPQSAPSGYVAHFAPPVVLRRSALRANSRQRRHLKLQIENLYLRYGDISVPVEIVHGTVDAIVSADIHAKKLVRDIRGAELDLLEGIGHMPHHVAIDRVVAAVDRAARRAGLLGTKK